MIAVFASVLAVFVSAIIPSVETCISPTPPVFQNEVKTINSSYIEWSQMTKRAKGVFRITIEDLDYPYNLYTGTGFLCRLPIEEEMMTGLMTNAHVINEGHLNNGVTVDIDVDRDNSYPVNIAINLKDNVIRSFIGETDDLDVTFLQLREEALHKLLIAGIEPLDLSLGTSRLGQDIKVLQHPDGGPLKIASGRIIETGDILCRHDASTEGGSSGSPVFDLPDLNVIAIHKGSVVNQTVNLAVNMTFVVDAISKNFGASVIKFNCTAPSVKHGTILQQTGGIVRPGTLFADDAVISLSCDHGFVPSSRKHHTKKCSASGEWIPASPQFHCDIAPGCPERPHIAHGHISDGLSTVGARRTISCDTGYAVEDENKTITCQSDRRWSKPGSCEPIACSSPQIENGYANSGEPSTYGSSGRAVYCNQGYRVSSQGEMITCQANGRWSSNVWCIRRTVNIACCNIFTDGCCCERESGEILRESYAYMLIKLDCAWRGFEKCNIGWQC